MKRFLLCFLCLVLLTGCLAEPQIPTEPVTTAPTVPAATTEPAPTEPASTEPTLPQEQPGVPLLEQGSAAGETGNLIYIPNPHLESMVCPEIRLYGNGLLLFEHNFDGFMQLKRISLEDGCLLAEGSVPVTPSAEVQIGSGYIGISDSGTGQVLILNEFLEVETSYSVPQEGEYWCLNQELEDLFVFYPEKGLLRRNLASGETQWILDNVAYIQFHDTSSGYVLFSYTDRDTQKSHNRYLNLSTATLETVPVDGAIVSGTRSGEQMLLRQSVTAREYILIKQDTASTFAQTEGMATLLPGRRQLFLTDGSYRNLYLYDLDGKFLSHCRMPSIEYATIGTDLVWSGYWKGYFFRDTYDNAAHLMFWEPSVSQEGEDLAIKPLGAVEPGKSLLDTALYDRAAALSSQYGLDIRIAEQCALEYSHDSGEVLEDTYFVNKALDILEQAFRAYPEGFFRQLPYGSMHQIRIELVGNIRVKEDMNTHPVSVGGFAQAMADHYLIVVEGYAFDTETVFHELSHVIDKRLEWDAMLRPDALYSEETWLSLQPAGFRYAESYTDMPEQTSAFVNSGYFVREYSMTVPTEDRATLMALAMSDSAALSGNTGMVEKMRYYAACIRDCFDTTGWPEITPWESVLP